LNVQGLADAEQRFNGRRVDVPFHHADVATVQPGLEAELFLAQPCRDPRRSSLRAHRHGSRAYGRPPCPSVEYTPQRHDPAAGAGQWTSGDGENRTYFEGIE
jgi:hypothetical protein